MGPQAALANAQAKVQASQRAATHMNVLLAANHQAPHAAGRDTRGQTLRSPRCVNPSWG